MKQLPPANNRISREAQALCRYLLTRGAELLSDIDLLGIVLGSPALARTLCKRSYHWQNLSRAELTGLPRFSDNRVAQVMAMIELSGRIVSKPLDSGQPICCSADVTGVYGPRLSSRKQECFYVLALDTKNHVIAEHEVVRGALNRVEVPPREVFRPLIRAGAAHFIAIHNHPSGDPRPSSHDTGLCRVLVQIANLTEIELLDFIIVGSRGATSFRDSGLLPSE